MAILSSLLVLAGAAVNRGPYILAGNARHAASLFANNVGETAKGRKGTAFAVGKSFMAYGDPDFITKRIHGGFGSGEKIVDTVADDEEDGTHDTRLVIREPELGRMLKLAGREGSILSMIVRDGWDGTRLEARSRARESIASDYHFGALGDITIEELGSV